MKKLLLFQFQSNYKTDIGMFIGLVISFIVFKNLNFFTLLAPILILRAASIGDITQKTLKLMLTMPINLVTLVKSRYVYEAIYFVVTYGVLGIITYIKDPVDINVVLGAITALIILYNTFFAYTIHNDFSKHKATGTDFLVGLLPAIFLIIVHLVLMGISGEHVWILMMLPIPIISFIMLRHLYNKSITQLTTKDFA